MRASEKSYVLQSLYYTLYESAQHKADNADTDEETRIIRKEASKLLAKVHKLQKAVSQ